MAGKQRRSNPARKWDKVTAITGVVALVVSVLTLLITLFLSSESNRIAQESKGIADAANQIAQESKGIAQTANRIGQESNNIALTAQAVSGGSNRIAQEANDIAITAQAMSNESNRIAQEANNIALTAQAVTEGEIARQHESQIEINHFLATSPDLLAEQDAPWISRSELVPVLIQNDFWLSEKAQYKENSRKKYLFIFIINYGPGKVLWATISDLNWVPKKGQQVPTGLTVDQHLDMLPSGAFYAFLVDVLEVYDPINYLEETNFETLKFTVSITDELERNVEYLVNMADTWRFEF